MISAAERMAGGGAPAGHRSGDGKECSSKPRTSGRSGNGEVVHRDERGAELVEMAHRFVSRLAADRFLGYLRAQRGAMVGGPGAHTNRPELVAEHG